MHASAEPPKITPSTAWYWIGAFVMAVGIIGGVVWLSVSIATIVGRPNNYERINVPGERTLNFTEAGTFNLYAETSNPVYYYDSLVEPDVDVVGPDGNRVGTNIASTTETYDIGGRYGEKFATVDIPEPGNYVVSVTAGRGDGVKPVRIAVGQSIAGADDARAIIGAVLVAIVGFFGGLIILIVTGVKRGKVKKALAPPVPPRFGPGPGGPGFGGPPPGYGFGGTPPGYGYAGQPPGYGGAPQPSGAPPAYGGSPQPYGAPTPGAAPPSPAGPPPGEHPSWAAPAAPSSGGWGIPPSPPSGAVPVAAWPPPAPQPTPPGPIDLPPAAAGPAPAPVDPQSTTPPSADPTRPPPPPPAPPS
jgi:hypothetical protein